MDIEKIILGTYCSTGTGYIRNHLNSKCPKQWKAIFLELRPEQYKKNLDYEKKEAERERKEDEQLKKEENLEYKKDKKSMETAWEKRLKSQLNYY